MRNMFNRLSALMAAGAVTFATSTGAVMAQPDKMQGIVQFENGLAIPKGQIEIYLEDSAIQTTARESPLKTQLESHGKERTMIFSLPSSALVNARSDTVQIVARLERDDGWLLARGSAQLEAGQPVEITLNTVMY